MRAAAASVGGVSAPSTAPPSPVPRYPPAAWLPSQSGSLRSFLGLSPEAGLRVSSRQCQGPGAIPLSRLRTAPSTGRGDRAGTRELLSHLPPRDSGYTGDLGTSRHASPCSGPFSQTSPMPTLGGLPFPVLPTMGISGVGTPSAASWRLFRPLITLLGSSLDDHYAARYQSDSRVSTGPEFCLYPVMILSSPHHDTEKQAS